MVDKSGAVDNQTAWRIVGFRALTLYELPLKDRTVEVLQGYVTKNSVEKPDIWAAREVTLDAKDKLTPVLIGVWDSGVDVTIFTGQVYDDPALVGTIRTALLSTIRAAIRQVFSCPSRTIFEENTRPFSPS